MTALVATRRVLRVLPLEQDGPPCPSPFGRCTCPSLPPTLEREVKTPAEWHPSRAYAWAGAALTVLSLAVGLL
jgi:hypothetical protein